MSAIAGFLATASPPDATRLLSGLAGHLTRRGPDGCRIVHRGRVGMVHRPFHTVPGTRVPGQPLEGRDGVLLAWDGRLDDGGDVSGGEAGDAERALTAYRRWGSAFADHLVGDFAASLWDPGRQRLLLTRDPFSDRPLFYAHTDDGLFLWASNVTSLRAVGRLGDHLDEEWIGGFLCSLLPEGRTVYRHVRSLPPGHILILDRDGLRLRRYWPGDHLGEVRCADDGEYEERFRSLFRQAVASRLRRRAPVFSELSGGLDSSSIVCMADRLLRAEGTGREELHTCSYVFDDSPVSDERRHMARIEEHVGRPRIHVSDHDAPLMANLAEPWGEQPNFMGNFRLRSLHSAREMRRHGARVLLSGIAGDDIGMSESEPPPQLADLASGGRLFALLSEMRRWHTHTRRPYTSLAWHGVVVPLLPAALRIRMGRGHPELDWAGDRFRHLLDMGRRARSLFPGEAERGIRRRSIAERAAGLRFTVRNAIGTRYQATELLGVERRFPFLHRPLVELALGVPLDQLVREGENRSLHRRAMSGILPPATAHRRDKAGPSEAVMRAIDRTWPELRRLFSSDALVFQAGWVKPEPFLHALELARFGMLHRAILVVNVIELENWLRGQEGVAAGVRASAATA